MSDQPLEKEFELIAFLQAKAREAEGVYVGIGDDAAVLPPSPHPHVVTCDTLVEGIHFERNWMEPRALGQKALSVSVSDLAAMGVEPAYALLSMSFPSETSQPWFERFAEGFMEEAERWSISLVGGDTTGSPGPISLTVTLFGYAGSAPLLRSGGKVDDGIYVTGTLGDSALGLVLLRDHPEMADRYAGMVARHCTPDARVHWGMLLAREELASACIDVSDGLLQDAGHLARGAGCAARIHAEALPLSAEFNTAVREIGLSSPVLLAAAGGEDYELVFTSSKGDSLPSELHGVPATRVGTLIEGKSGRVEIVDAAGAAIEPGPAGWNHF